MYHSDRWHLVSKILAYTEYESHTVLTYGILGNVIFSVSFLSCESFVNQELVVTEDGGMEEVHLCSKAVWCPITVLQKDGHYFQRREHLNTVLWFPIVSCGTAYKPR